MIRRISFLLFLTIHVYLNLSWGEADATYQSEPVTKCLESEVKNPDGESWIDSGDLFKNFGINEDLVPDGLKKWVQSTKVKDVNDVMFYRGEKTTRSANHGVKSFFAHSILADETFFKMAKQFYLQLGQLEKTDQSTIESSAGIDLYQLALKIAKGNNYLALKILAVYGHDDQVNDFQNVLVNGQTKGGYFCRLKELDRFKPDFESILYRSGAIGNLTYANSDILKGKEIANNCMKISQEKFPSLFEFCNDFSPKYRADYYHVIFSAFLTCREKVRTQLLPKKEVAPKLVGQLIDHVYIERVRQYKIDRFKEEIIMMKGHKLNQDELLAIDFLEKLFLLRTDSAFAAKQPPGIEVVLRGRMSQNPEVNNFVSAILERYLFEIEFRQRQHEMGMNFAKENCKDVPMACQ